MVGNSRNILQRRCIGRSLCGWRISRLFANCSSSASGSDHSAGAGSSGGFPRPAAVLEAVVPDRARITVDAIRIGPPEFRRDLANPDRTPRLLIYFTITNLGNRPLDYLSWGPGGRIATLSAMNGVQLSPIMFPKGTLLNHPQQATVSPHGQVRDVLVYAPINPMPHLLALDLPCGNIGSIGSMHLLVPNSVGGETK